MKTIKFFILSALMLGAIACTQERVENNDSGLVAAKVTAGMFTKADGANWTCDQIGVFAVSPDDMAAEYQNVGYVTESTSTTATFTALAGEIYLTADETTFSAYAPYQSGLADGVISGNTADQSVPTALDFLFAEGATASMASPVVNFTFSHQMTQLIVNFVSTNDDAVDVVKAGAYTVGGLVLGGTFDVLTGETEVSGSVAEMTISGNCLSADVTGDYDGIAYQMLLFPQTAEVYFAGTVNGEEFTTTAVSQTLEAGYSYNCTIELTIDEVTGEVTATVEGSTINDWEYGEWNSGEEEPGAEEPTSIDLSNPETSGEGYTYESNVLTITANAVITGGTETSPYTGEIKIDTGVTEVELNGVYIDWNESNDKTAKSAAMTISSDLTLVLTGDNTILMNVSESGTQHECIYVNGGTLTITGEGSLTLNEDLNDASYSNHNLHGGLILDGNANLIIESGTITANGYFRQPAIGALGGDNAGTCGDITINGGTIVAVGGGRSCGIGTGHNGKCGKITINGGDITTSVMSGGNGGGIGSGDTGTCGDIIINGGTVNATATSGTYCAAIGSINASAGNGVCGDIYITKNVTSLTATGGNTVESYVIGLGKSDTTCGTVYLGGESATDTSVKEWTPEAGQFTVTGGGDDVSLVYGWVEEDDTWHRPTD